MNALGKYSDEHEYIGSWFSKAVRAIAPIAAPIVTAINPAAGIALTAGANTLFPGATSGQNPNDVPQASVQQFNQSAIQPVQPPAPQAPQTWVQGVPNIAVIGGGAVLALAAVAVIARRK